MGVDLDVLRVVVVVKSDAQNSAYGEMDLTVQSTAKLGMLKASCFIGIFSEVDIMML